MKTKRNTALIFALGVLTTGAFAENSPTTSTASAAAIAATVSAPDWIADTSSLPASTEPSRAAVTPAPTARQIAQLEHDFSTKYQADDGLAGRLAIQTPPDLRGLLTGPESPKVVLSQSPSPVFFYDENAPAHWDPSITLRFDWGRSRHS